MKFIIWSIFYKEFITAKVFEHPRCEIISYYQSIFHLHLNYINLNCWIFGHANCVFFYQYSIFLSLQFALFSSITVHVSGNLFNTMSKYMYTGDFVWHFIYIYVGNFHWNNLFITIGLNTEICIVIANCVMSSILEILISIIFVRID